MPRPYILANFAMSLDGKIDTVARTGASISSAADKARVDRLRAGVDAVLVGGRTLLAEDPRLTVKSLALREERKALGLPENPAKVGLVSVADLDPVGEFMTAGPARRLIYTTARTAAGQVARLRQAGAEVFVFDGERPDPEASLESLYGLGVRRLLAEGGGTILAEFFRLGLVDEVSVYIAPTIYGGASAPTPADGPGWPLDQVPRLQLISAEKFDEQGGVLLQYSIQQS